MKQCVYVIRTAQGRQIGRRFKTKRAAVKYLRKVNAHRTVQHKRAVRLK